jgi:hypothetical protein
MYIEIKGRLKAIDQILHSNQFYFIDQRLEQIITELKHSVEFLAKKIHDIEKPAVDPHRHIPGDDD